MDGSFRLMPDSDVRTSLRKPMATIEHVVL
jgi:hypothetical protein